MKTIYNKIKFMLLKKKIQKQKNKKDRFVY